MVSAVVSWLLPRRWIRVELPRIAPRVRECEIRELLLERHVVHVDAVAQRRLHPAEHTDRGLQRDVDDVVGEPATVQESRRVASKDAERAGFALGTMSVLRRSISAGLTPAG